MVVTVTRLSPAGITENHGHDVYDVSTDVDEWGLRVDMGDFRLDDLNSITGLMRRAHEAGARGEAFSVVETTTDGWPDLDVVENDDGTLTVTTGPNTGDVLAWDETLQSYMTISKGEGMNNTIKRKAWVVYFPQFDKYYPYVGRGSNSYTYDLVGAENAHVFTQLTTAKRVMKIYEDLGRRTNRSRVPPSEVTLCDIGLGDTGLTKRPCAPNAVAKFEKEARGTITLSGTPMDHWNYDSRKSVVPYPYNTPLEVQLVEFEINIPVK